MMNLMRHPPNFLARFQTRVLRISIFNRVLIGNSLIIILGAIGGTIFTRHLTLLGNIRLILLFSFFGILITLIVNYWIIRTALRPLYELGNALERVDGGQIRIPESLKKYQDPYIHHLVTALNSTLVHLENRTSQLQAISERAIRSQEEERIRIARGLHDDTAQAISILIIRLERLEGMIPIGFPHLAENVADARKLLIRLLEDVRKIIWDLRPSILDDLGLIPAIRWFARSNLEETGITVNFEVGTDFMRLPSRLETTLFRVAQETVNNILRHAEARNVSIRLWPEEGIVYLEVQDDGQGFDVERISGEAVSKKQLGLLGVKERVSLVGGRVKVESVLGSGSRVRVSIPLSGEEWTEYDETEKINLEESDVLR